MTYIDKLYVQGKTLLITGATGYIGSLLSEYILSNFNIKKLISYSRRWNEAEQLSRKLNDKRFRFINSDICNWHGIYSATKNVDLIIACHAYKSVPSSEYNASECKRVNVDGTETLIKASIENDVKKVLFISSDKAASAINAYGRSKALAESLIVNANNLSKKTRFSVVRYGNVVGSTGSVIPLFESLIKENKVLPITDPQMTRYWFRANDAVKYVTKCLIEMIGGEVFIPKLKSSTIIDLINALEKKYYTDIKTKDIGLRPGEKKHEEMISEEEAYRTLEKDWTYIIAPFQHDWNGDWYKEIDAKNKVDFDKYTSYNAKRITIEELTNEFL